MDSQVRCLIVGGQKQDHEHPDGEEVRGTGKNQRSYDEKIDNLDVFDKVEMKVKNFQDFSKI